MLWHDTKKITDVFLPYFQVLGNFFITITKIGIAKQLEILFHQAFDQASDTSTLLCSMQPLPFDENWCKGGNCLPSSPRWWQWLGLEVPDSFSHSWLILFQWLSQISGLAMGKDLKKHHLSLKGERSKEVGGQRKLLFFSTLDGCSLAFPKSGFHG